MADIKRTPEHIEFAIRELEQFRAEAICRGEIKYVEGCDLQLDCLQWILGEDNAFGELMKTWAGIYARENWPN